MYFLTPQDGSQLALMALKIKSGKDKAEAYKQAQIKDPFARQVAKAMAGKGASADARSAAESLMNWAQQFGP